MIHHSALLLGKPKLAAPRPLTGAGISDNGLILRWVRRIVEGLSATLPEVNASPTSGAFIGSASRRLCSHLKHDFAWSVACGAALKRFACAGQWKYLG